MANWYFSTGGKAEGPVGEGDVLAALKTEQLNLVDLVFEEGSAAWLTIGEVPLFRDAFHAFKKQQAAEAARLAQAEMARLKKEANAREAHSNSLAAVASQPDPHLSAERKRMQQAKLQAAVEQTAKVSKSLQPQSIAALSALDEWVILRKSGDQFEQIGPFTREFVLAKLGTGEIEYSQFAWKPGFQRWVRIGNLSEFDRRRPDRDAVDVARIIATVPTPSWEQDAIKAASSFHESSKEKFDDLHTSVLQFDPPLGDMIKNASRDLPPSEASGQDLLGSSSAPAIKQIGQADDEAEEIYSAKFSFVDELTPLPFSESKPSSLKPLSTPVARAISEASRASNDNSESRPFDELTQPSFHIGSVEYAAEFNDEKTGDFSQYLETKPVPAPKLGGPPETISRRIDGPPPVKKNSKVDLHAEAQLAPPPLIEELDKTKIESSFSLSVLGATSLTLVERQAALLNSETFVASPSKSLKTSSSDRSKTPPIPRNEFASKPLADTQPSPVLNEQVQAIPSVREGSFAAGSLREALLNSQSPQRQGDAQSIDPKKIAIEIAQEMPDGQATKVGASIVSLKSEPSLRSVYEELADGRTIVAPIATFSRHSGDREKRDGDLAATRSSAVSSDETLPADVKTLVKTLGKTRGIRKSRRAQPTSQFVKFARLFIAGLVLGLIGLYGFHVYSTRQLGLGPHPFSQTDDEVQGPPDVVAEQKPIEKINQQMIPPVAQAQQFNIGSQPSATNAALPKNTISLKPSTADVTTSAPPPNPVNPLVAADKKTSAKADPKMDTRDDSDETDDRSEVADVSKGSKSPLALSVLSGVKQVAPAAKASILEILPYRLGSETPLLLLQTNAPVGERLMVRIRGRSGEILKLKSYARVLKVIRNANEYPGFDLSKLKLPPGSYKIEAAVGELKKTTQVFVGVRDAKYSAEIEHHLKEISFEQQREKKSMFYAAKTFESLAQNLSENFDKLHGQTGAWKSFLRSWNRQMSAARSPIVSMLGDRRNFPMAYPDEMRGLVSMVGQLSAEAKELDTAVVQKRDVASQTTTELAKEFARIKQEIAMISSRRTF